MLCKNKQILPLFLVNLIQIVYFIFEFVFGVYLVGKYVAKCIKVTCDKNVYSFIIIFMEKMRLKVYDKIILKF